MIEGLPCFQMKQGKEIADLHIEASSLRSSSVRTPSRFFRARSFMRALSPSANVSSTSDRAATGERSFFSGMIVLVQISASVSGVTVVWAIPETGCQDYGTIMLSDLGRATDTVSNRRGTSAIVKSRHAD